ncbi:MAG: hypothetical protein AAF658_11885 [Myxococcota bacterium]
MSNPIETRPFGLNELFTVANPRTDFTKAWNHVIEDGSLSEADSTYLKDKVGPVSVAEMAEANAVMRRIARANFAGLINRDTYDSLTSTVAEATDPSNHEFPFVPQHWFARSVVDTLWSALWNPGKYFGKNPVTPESVRFVEKDL